MFQYIAITVPSRKIALWLVCTELEEGVRAAARGIVVDGHRMRDIEDLWY